MNVPASFVIAVKEASVSMMSWHFWGRRPEFRRVVDSKPPSFDELQKHGLRHGVSYAVEHG